jgi:hypothetical protein
LNEAATIEVLVSRVPVKKKDDVAKITSPFFFIVILIDRWFAQAIEN